MTFTLIRDGISIGLLQAGPPRVRWQSGLAWVNLNRDLTSGRAAEWPWLRASVGAAW